MVDLNVILPPQRIFVDDTGREHKDIRYVRLHDPVHFDNSDTPFYMINVPRHCFTHEQLSVLKDRRCLMNRRFRTYKISSKYKPDIQADSQEIWDSLFSNKEYSEALSTDRDRIWSACTLQIGIVLRDFNFKCPLTKKQLTACSMFLQEVTVIGYDQNWSCEHG